MEDNIGFIIVPTNGVGDGTIDDSGDGATDGENIGSTFGTGDGDIPCLLSGTRIDTFINEGDGDNNGEGDE